MEYDREAGDIVYTLRKITTIELQLAGPAYWILFDVEGEGWDYTISNIRFKYAWWSEPVITLQADEYADPKQLFEWFVEEFCGGDVSRAQKVTINS